MNMRKIAAIACLAIVVAPVQASWLYCKFKSTDCTYIQGTLIPFDKAETIIEDCRALTRNNIGVRAMNMSWDSVMKASNGNTSHPLLRAQLAYQGLHDSPLKFDRTIPIEHRYPQVRQACGQAFGDMQMQ